LQSPYLPREVVKFITPLTLFLVAFYLSVIPTPVTSAPVFIAAFALLADSIFLRRLVTRLRQVKTENPLHIDSVRNALKKEFGIVIATIFAPVFYVVVYGCFAERFSTIHDTSNLRFSCIKATHNKDIFWIVFVAQIPTLPLIHWFIETEANPLVAWLVTGLTLWSVLHFWAQHYAISTNPIEINNDTIHYRFGFSWYAEIPLQTIESVRAVTFQDTHFNSSYFLSPFGTSKNVVLHFKAPIEFKRGLCKRKRKLNAVIAVDNASEFIHTVNQQLGHLTGRNNG
jgi:hypothetical protein